MNKNDAKQLAQYLIENYPKDYPKEMSMPRVTALVEDLYETYGAYEMNDVLTAFRKWRETSKWKPYPREIIPMLPKKSQRDPNAPHRLARDSDGCVYDMDEDGGTCIYKPWWEDDDPRVMAYFNRFREE